MTPRAERPAQFAQSNLTRAYKQVVVQARDFVNLNTFVRNGPGSSNYPYWAGTSAANAFSARSAVLFADYLDPYDTAAGLAKGLSLCAPVLRLPENDSLGNGPVPTPPGTEPVYIKSREWPTGNNPTLSKLRYPAGLLEGPLYGRGSNASGLILAPRVDYTSAITRSRPPTAGHGGPGLLRRSPRRPRRQGPRPVTNGDTLGRPTRRAAAPLA
jgi:hypothetical protein